MRVWKIETGMDWQIGWVGKAVEILIVGLVLWVRYPVEAIFFADFETPWCKFCTRMPEMSDLSFRKNSNALQRLMGIISLCTQIWHQHESAVHFNETSILCLNYLAVISTVFCMEIYWVYLVFGGFGDRMFQW